ncbi:MAG: hypothetical protein H0Z37_00695 [Firmicutes bacterium]|nr:hypothetical protein [Bacillota bacterium]
MPSPTAKSRNFYSTFVIRVLRTPDGDWRGRIQHVQSGTARTFRNFVEVVRFIDEHALRGDAAIDRD